MNVVYDLSNVPVYLPFLPHPPQTQPHTYPHNSRRHRDINAVFPRASGGHDGRDEQPVETRPRATRGQLTEGHVDDRQAASVGGE